MIHGVKKPVKDLIAKVAWKTRLTRHLARKVRNGALVLAYHSTPAARSKSGYEYAVPLDAVVQHLRFLVVTGRVMSLSRLFDQKQEEAAPAEGRAVCYAITADDGYRSNYEHLFPLLCDERLPATFFLTLSELQQTSESFLGWKEVKEMHASGLVSFGVHCWRHVPLTAMDPREAQRDLARAKEELEGQLGEECPFLAYPFGAFDRNVAEMAKRVGFRAAFADRPRPAVRGRFGVPRLTVGHDTAPIEQATLRIVRALWDTGERPWHDEDPVLGCDAEGGA